MNCRAEFRLVRWMGAETPRHPHGGERASIQEVYYYGDDETPYGGAGPVDLYLVSEAGSAVDELRREMTTMLAAFDKPVIERETLRMEHPKCG